MDWNLALTLVKWLVQIVSWLEQRQWYQAGRVAMYKELSDEQKARIAIAEAARRDADIYASGELHDPNQRD